VAEFFELFFIEEVVRDLEHRAFFFVNVMLDEILEHVELGFELFLTGLEALNAFEHRFDQSVLFKRLRNLDALLGLFCAPAQLGIKHIFLDNRVHAQIAIDLLEQGPAFGGVFRVRHLVEERFDFPMLMFQKIEGIHHCYLRATAIPN